MSIKVLSSYPTFANDTNNDSKQAPTVELEVDPRILPAGFRISTDIRIGKEHFQQNSKDRLLVKMTNSDSAKPAKITITVEPTNGQINKKAVLMTVLAVGVLSTLAARYFLSRLS